MRSLERLIVYPLVSALLVTTITLWRQQQNLEQIINRQSVATRPIVQEQQPPTSKTEKKTAAKKEQSDKTLDQILAPFYDGVSEVGKLLDRLPDLSPVSH